LSRKKDKIEISKRILYELVEEIGPFINIDTGKKISNAKARDKIGHALRVYYKNHILKKNTMAHEIDFDGFKLDLGGKYTHYIDSVNISQVVKELENDSTIKSCSNKFHNSLAFRKISS